MNAPEGALAVRTAVSHARARWAGAVLLGLGIVEVGVLVGVALWTDGRWGPPVLAAGAALLGLVAFGVHSDTALALLRDQRWHPDVPPALRREMDDEFLLRRRALSELHPTPCAAWAVTALSFLALTGAVARAAW
ncbi:MAG: hypothetical protein JXB39_13100 [Deltaproteobacteria bacterium]|nr:hypothetical protein [Deltaproteobacteria bacterium]